MGKYLIPIEWPKNQLNLRLDEIVGVHPAVLKMIAPLTAEPIVGLRGLSDVPINGVYWFPRIAVVPVPGGSGYWCWIGVRSYLRLVDRGWLGKIAVLDYGPRISEEKIVDLARFDWKCASAITGSAQTTDWAIAQMWEEDTDSLCRPVESGNRRPNGLKSFARLRGLDPRRLRADHAPKAAKSTDGPDTTTDDEEEGNKN